MIEFFEINKFALMYVLVGLLSIGAYFLAEWIYNMLLKKVDWITELNVFMFFIFILLLLFTIIFF